MKKTCTLCPHLCELDEGQLGFCGARTCKDGTIVSTNYGQLTALALDPIEKKPLARFFPGSRILSLGSYGCNLKCPFCQNAEISTARAGEIPTRYFSPEDIVKIAKELRTEGNIGVAYTYNEPMIGYEYMTDCAKLIHDAGMKNVVVTNGMINPEPLEKLLPLIDAMNIDLKGYSERFYQWVGGSFDCVKESIQKVAASCHLEVTTLVIPGKNDLPEEMEEESSWLAEIDPNIPLHLSRFFPQHKCMDIPVTPIATLKQLKAIAERHLHTVLLGNC